MSVRLRKLCSKAPRPTRCCYKPRDLGKVNARVLIRTDDVNPRCKFHSHRVIANSYDEAKERNVYLLCAFNRRFDPSLRRLKEDITAGKIGKVRLVKTCSRDYPFPPISYLKGTKGMFHDCSIHDVDLILWLLGEKPTTVYSQASANIAGVAAIGDVDTVMTTMKFPSGVLGQIELCRFASYGYDQRVEVLGETGMLQSMNQPKTSVVYSNAKGVTEDVLKHSFEQRYLDSYRVELDHFCDLLEGKDEPLIRKEDVLTASEVVEASEKSYRSGQVVKFSYR